MFNSKFIGSFNRKKKSTYSLKLYQYLFNLKVKEDFLFVYLF